MRRTTRQAAFWRILKPILRYDLLIFGGVGLVCLVVPDWRSLYDYSNGLLLVSAGLLMFTFISFFGGWTSTSNFRYQYANTINPESAHERTKRTFAVRNNRLREALETGLICLLPLLVAFIIQFLFL